jgi:hypothetical protein
MAVEGFIGAVIGAAVQIGSNVYNGDAWNKDLGKAAWNGFVDGVESGGITVLTVIAPPVAAGLLVYSAIRKTILESEDGWDWGKFIENIAIGAIMTYVPGLSNSNQLKDALKIGKTATEFFTKDFLKVLGKEIANDVPVVLKEIPILLRNAGIGQLIKTVADYLLEHWSELDEKAKEFTDETWKTFNEKCNGLIDEVIAILQEQYDSTDGTDTEKEDSGTFDGPIFQPMRLILE